MNITLFQNYKQLPHLETTEQVKAIFNVDSYISVYSKFVLIAQTFCTAILEKTDKSKFELY